MSDMAPFNQHVLKGHCDGQGEGDGTLLAPETKLPEPLGNEAMLLPQRRVDVDLAAVSSVLSQRMLCHPNAPLEFQQNTIPHRGAAKDTREVRPPCPDSPPAPAAIMGPCKLQRSVQVDMGEVSCTHPRKA